MDASRLASSVPRQMQAGDACSRALGMEVLEVSEGAARFRMAVREDMVNSHGTAHGGMIFSLADSTFAYASNSRNQRAVAVTCSIEFLRPARLGDTLTATATEQALAGRSGIYDVRVENQDGLLIALFRGKSAAIPGTVIPDSAAPA